MPTSFEKTWQFCSNQAYVGTDSNKHIAWFIKASLLGEVAYVDAFGVSIPSPLGLWTTVASCDSLSVSASDLWGSSFDGSKIVCAGDGSTHSWYQLYNAGLGMYLVIHPSNNNYFANTFSPTLQTDGSTTQRPKCTLSDILAAPRYYNSEAGNFNIALTTEGSFVMFWTLTSSVAIRGVMMCCELLETHTADDHPIFCYGNESMFTASALSQYGGMVQPFTHAAAKAGGIVYHHSSPTSNYLDNVALDPVDGLANDLPIYILASSAPNSIRGRLPDVHWASSLLGSNTWEPSVGQITSVTVNSVWVPAYTSITF
jgi:hypothetical protein